jgi:hypothetical protein
MTVVEGWLSRLPDSNRHEAPRTLYLSRVGYSPYRVYPFRHGLVAREGRTTSAKPFEPREE